MLKSHEISHGYDFPRYWDHSTVNIFQSDHHFLVYQAPLESPCSWFQVTGIPPAWTRVLLKKRIVLFPRSPPHLHFQKLQGPQIFVLICVFTEMFISFCQQILVGLKCQSLVHFILQTRSSNERNLYCLVLSKSELLFARAGILVIC